MRLESPRIVGSLKLRLGAGEDYTGTFYSGGYSDMRINVWGGNITASFVPFPLLSLFLLFSSSLSLCLHF